MTNLFFIILFSTFGYLHCQNTSFDQLPSVEQIQTAADYVKDFIGKHLAKLAEKSALSNSTEDSESTEQKVEALKSGFFNLFNSLRTNNLVSTDQSVQGPNICFRGELRNLPNNDYGKFSGSLKCHQFQHAVRCFEQLVIPEGSNETMRLRKCCDGFKTEDILTEGCTKEVKQIPSLKDIAFLYEYSGKLSSKFSKSTFIITRNSSSNIVTLPGLQYVYDWFHGSSILDNHGRPYVVSQKLENVHRVETYLNCVNLNYTDINAEEGVIHVAKAPLSPAYTTVLDLLEDKFSEFARLLPKSTRQLLNSTSGKMYTVFAIPNEKLSPYGKYFLKRVFAMNNDFAQAHIFKTFTCSYQLPNTKFITSNGNEYSVNKDSDGITIIGSSKIIHTDFVAANGVVHSIDKLLNEWNYRMWYERLKSYNPEFVKELLVQYPEDEPKTIFIPPKHSYKVIKSDLPNYVIREAVDDFSFASSVHTDGKSKYFFGRFPQSEPRWNVSTSGDEPYEKLKTIQLGCNKLLPTVMKAFNSYVYFLEKPLPITGESALDFLKDRPEMSNIADIWQLFLNETNVPSGFSLFASVNDALAKNDMKKLQTNNEEAISFIRSHMILDPICEFTLKDGIETEFETLNKEKVVLKSLNGTIYFGKEQVMARHVLSDGVLFVMERLGSISE